MNTIRYWTSHDNKSSAYWNEWFTATSSVVNPLELEFLYDEKAPDYLFVTEHIDHIPRRFREFIELNDGRRISVFAGGEAISPDMNLFDYACSFDKTLVNGDRCTRKPPCLFFKHHIFTPLTEGCKDVVSELKSKTGFCNFIYSNPSAHPRRDQLFYAISQYRQVDALGPHLNNIGNRTSRTSHNWRRILVEMKRPYKFSIAAENACYDGYVTEKLISSFQAHTIPIYWGSPSVAEEFNPKAFINANKLSDEELIALVKNIDANDELWCEIASQPAMTNEQQANLAVESDQFVKFSAAIFDARPLEEKKRVPAGYWNDIYKRSLMRCGMPKWLRF